MVLEILVFENIKSYNIFLLFGDVLSFAFLVPIIGFRFYLYTIAVKKSGRKEVSHSTPYTHVCGATG